MTRFIDVDAIAPVTEGVYELARRRVDDIVKNWGHRLSVWGSSGEDGAHL